MPFNLLVPWRRVSELRTKKSFSWREVLELVSQRRKTFRTKNGWFKNQNRIILLSGGFWTKDEEFWSRLAGVFWTRIEERMMIIRVRGSRQCFSPAYTGSVWVWTPPEGPAECTHVSRWYLGTVTYDQCCGPGMIIPDPGSAFFLSRIPEPG